MPHYDVTLTLIQLCYKVRGRLWPAVMKVYKWDLSNDIVSIKIHDKRDDFDFEIVNFPFLDGDVPRFTSYHVGLENCTRPLVFTSASGCRASENFDISSENEFFPIYSQ